MNDIESRLDVLKPGSEMVKMQEEFTSIAKDLQELQRYFTGSTIFLSDHKIQRCQNIINQLVTKLDESKARLAPKKKFGFKNKSAVIQPKAETKVDGVEKEVIHKEFQWTETKKKNEYIELGAEEANNQDLTFKEMENCVIIIKGHPGSLQMLNMKTVWCYAVQSLDQYSAIIAKTVHLPSHVSNFVFILQNRVVFIYWSHHEQSSRIVEISSLPQAITPTRVLTTI